MRALISVTTLLLLVSSASYADVFKCVGDNGETLYQGHPCGQGGGPVSDPAPRQPQAPGVAERRYRDYLRQREQEDAEREAQRAQSRAADEYRLSQQRERARQAELRDQQKKCQRDLRLAHMRHEHVDFTCNELGYAARPKVAAPYGRPAHRTQPPTTRYVPSVRKTCTDFHNGAPPQCF